jgi:hypothetical protein
LSKDSRGGVIHSIGNALLEQMLYDETGQPLTTNYGEHLLPTAPEMPRIEIEHVEIASPLNPLNPIGAKGEAKVEQFQQTLQHLGHKICRFRFRGQIVRASCYPTTNDY